MKGTGKPGFSKDDTFRDTQGCKGLGPRSLSIKKKVYSSIPHTYT